MWCNLLDLLGSFSLHVRELMLQVIQPSGLIIDAGGKTWLCRIA